MKCEKCGQEINALLVDVFRYDGSDDFDKHPVFECEENAAYIETTQNWTGYEQSEEEMLDTIVCPYCKQFPFQSKEIQVYDVVRVVCFKKGEVLKDGVKRKWEEAREDLSREMGYSHIWKRLAAIEDILGDAYDLDRLRELVEADQEGRCVVLPCGVGDSVFHITTCERFSKVLDGTMYGANGGHGTATGYYCPCELTENCPFQLEEDGSFDCEKHKNTAAIYEDIATEIVVNDMESYVRLDYSGCVDFDEFDKTVFLTRESAEEALKERE